MDVSVVIGFRNWGTERLLLAIKSIQESFGNEVDFEIIVSDFGSELKNQNQELVEASGAKYIYSESEIWSRARALNAGIAVSSGRYVFCTDADMIFAPGSLQYVFQQIDTRESGVYFIQCRDLPETFDAESIANRGFEWNLYEANSTLRPRWGMGGLVAFSRAACDAIRGFDERMHTYGGEDLDFAQRMQLSGYRNVWLEDSGVRMYHIWHPSSSEKAKNDAEGKRALESNRAILKNDPTLIRNLDGNVFYRPLEPLVSVVICTFNRADLIAESINSVLNQTFRDFELIVVDDGSEDDTESVVSSFSDPRLRYVKQDNGGISKARNRGTDLARGRFIAVHDDDDLMLPTRLRSSLNAVRQGVRATFGSWINFDHDTGEFQINVSKKDFTPAVVWEHGPAPGHATWLVETTLMREVRYDEALTSAVDHNLATRLAMSGVKWAHCGAVLFLRRKHSRQITEHDGRRQSGAAELTRKWVVSARSTDERAMLEAESRKTPYPKVSKSNLEQFLPWLSDHLVYRAGRVVLSGEECDRFSQALKNVRARIALEGSALNEPCEILYVEDLSWEDLVELREEGIDVDLSATARRSSPTRPNLGDISEAELNKELSLLAARLATASGAESVAVIEKSDGIPGPSGVSAIVSTKPEKTPRHYTLVISDNPGELSSIFYDEEFQGWLVRK